MLFCNADNYFIVQKIILGRANTNEKKKKKLRLALVRLQVFVKKIFEVKLTSLAQH